MIFYSPAPMELFDVSENKELIHIKLPSGGFISAEPSSYKKLKVIDIVSTDPMDYMNSRIQPGQILELKVSL